MERPIVALDLNRAEVDLRESESLFRALAENVEVVFYVHEIDQQRISYVSPAYERIWCQSASEIYADPVAFLRDIHADDRPQVEMAMKHQQAGENTETRYRLVLPGGGIRHIHDRSFVTNRPGDEVRRVVGIAEDVTERTEERLKLASSAATFEALVRNNPFGVYVVGSDFKMLHTSLGTVGVFGEVYPLIGRDFSEIVRILWPEPFASEVIGRFQQTLETGEFYINHGVVKKRKNIDRTEAYEWRIDRMTLPDGTFGVVCHFFDLSEHVALETQLKQAVDDKDMLIREIDHRVRNSIAIIAGLLTMQCGTTQSAEVRQALDVASARLIAVARIHERLYKGKEIGIVEFGTYLEEICRDLRTSLRHSNMTMAKTTECDLSVDQAIPLGLIANELVTNAFKHCDDSKATISVDLECDATSLTLTVSDTGVGMPGDYDPLIKASLGMKVIDTLVRQLNGSLVLPAAGAKARFQVNIPLMR